MTTVYLSGPMRGIESFNFAAFAEATESLRERGYIVVSPHEHDLQNGFDPSKNNLEGFDLKTTLLWDLEQVAECDEVVCLPGWEHSLGARAEVALAWALGKTCRTYPDLTPFTIPTLEEKEALWTRELGFFNPRADEWRGADYTENVYEESLPQSWGPGTKVRQFNTGATRDTDEGKLDYEAFLSPQALKRYAEYLHSHRRQSDGTLRAGDNWQKGIPRDVYMKSVWRHLVSWWTNHRANEDPSEDICGVLFNAFGYLHELVKHHPGQTHAE